MQKTPGSDNALRENQYNTSANLNARIRLHQRFSTASESWENFILDNLQLCPGETVLELGCGNASQTRNNRGSYPDTLRYFLADFSYGMLLEAVSELDQDARFAFSVQDAQALAFPDATFDCITANHMLYHVPDIKLALSEIYRLLKPGGRLMAATNGHRHMQDLDRLLSAFSPETPRLHAVHSRFTLEDGAQLITAVFGNCYLQPYFSELWVTEAQALTEYVLSMEGIRFNAINLNPQQLTAYFQKLIKSDGGIRIRKSSGLLLAVK